MSTVIGLDLGTSGVKAVLLDEAETVLADAEQPLRTQRPEPLASEQEIDVWIGAAETVLGRLRNGAPAAMAAVRGIGLTGQMHAAALLDAADRPVRPAMLWNDGRAHAEAAEFAAAGDELAAALGVRPMAGFTAPKLAWLGRHEPRTMAQARHLLNAKDVIRFHLTGERATDPSDAAGTWLFDQATRRWSERAIALTGIAPSLLPAITESTAATGTVRPDVASRLGLATGTVVAGGGGDTPTGGIGVGAVDDGDAFVSLGTSAQLFVAAEAHRPAPAQMVHAFCHALPNRWCQMAAMLNGASVLDLITRLTGRTDPAALLAEAEVRFNGPGKLLLLPYLQGERTPHDDPRARGVVLGLSGDTTAADLALAALEGVAFSFADARDALAAAGTRVMRASCIGGGARSRLWCHILAAVLDIPLNRHAGGERGPAFGAARLARASLGETPRYAPPPVLETIAPDPALAAAYQPRVAAFRALYQAVRPCFRETA